MFNKLGYDIFTLLFDVLWMPHATHKLEWFVPHATAPAEGETILRSRGVRIYARNWDTNDDGSARTASVRVAVGQRKLAEEWLFVARGYQPACGILPATERRRATVEPYTPKRTWSSRKVGGSMIDRISDLLG